MDSAERLNRQIQFLLETEKLKGVLRRSYPVHADRRENAAEHSWTVTLTALLLAEHANEPIDLLRVLKMLLIHDLVEIDAGDTFHYDLAAHASKAERERQAAERLFGMLPSPQAEEFRALWDEFEAQASPEARFAAAVDRLIPILQNYSHKGKSWRENAVTSDQALTRNRHIAEGSDTLWRFTENILLESRRLNYFADSSKP